MATESKNDGLCMVKATRDYADRVVKLKKGQSKQVAVDHAKKVLKQHPVNPPIEVVDGLSKQESDEIAKFCADYKKKAVAASSKSVNPHPIIAEA